MSGLSKDNQYHVWPHSFLCLEITKTDMTRNEDQSDWWLADGHFIFHRGLCGYVSYGLTYSLYPPHPPTPNKRRKRTSGKMNNQYLKSSSCSVVKWSVFRIDIPSDKLIWHLLHTTHVAVGSKSAKHIKGTAGTLVLGCMEFLLVGKTDCWNLGYHINWMWHGSSRSGVQVMRIWRWHGWNDHRRIRRT